MRSRADFQRIQSSGRRVNTASFVLLLAPAERTADAPRLGITASKRVGNAVVRNRVKRVVREAFRATPELFAPGVDVVVIARPTAAALSPMQVTAEWQAAATRLERAAREARSQSGMPAQNRAPQ